MKKTISERVFSGVNALLLILTAMTIILPFMHIFSISVSKSSAVSALKVGLLPIGFNMAAYIELIKKELFISSAVNSVVLTLVYTGAALVINTLAAYGFSKPFYGKKFLTYVFIVTMYFGGGLIPTYMLMTNTLNLYNNYLAYILPALVSVFYIIVIRSQMESIPASLGEAAQIDGAGEFQVLVKIIIPTVKPTLAAIAMFLALGMWNMWYSVMLYSNKESMWTLQYLLRSIVFEKLLESRFGSGSSNMGQITSSTEADLNPYNYQMAAIITVALPIVCIYPFVQKYFVKGILVGSVKE